jgi:predicted RNA-binding protein with PIN domain
MTYYIDGYNVIHFCEELRPLAMHNFEAGRDALVEKVAQWCSETGEHAKIVFDGRGRRAENTAPPLGVAGLEVIYSPAHKSADTLIERMAYKSKNRRELVVVTGDFGIRDLCSSLGTLIMDPDNFLRTMDEAVRESRSDLRVRRNTNTKPTVEDQLGQDELAHLKKLRDKLDGK